MADIHPTPFALVAGVNSGCDGDMLKLPTDEEPQPMDPVLPYDGPSFFCRPQKNFAQVPTGWARKHLNRMGGWITKLHVNDPNDCAYVNVVKCNTTVRFSRGFTGFMKTHEIDMKDPLLFTKVGEREFMVQKLSPDALAALRAAN